MAEPRKPVKLYTGPHAEDALLRYAGFSIHSRPEKGEAIWTKDGNPYTLREAVHWAMMHAPAKSG